MPTPPSDRSWGGCVVIQAISTAPNETAFNQNNHERPSCVATSVARSGPATRVMAFVELCSEIALVIADSGTTRGASAMYAGIMIDCARPRTIESIDTVSTVAA